MQLRSGVPNASQLDPHRPLAASNGHAQACGLMAALVAISSSSWARKTLSEHGPERGNAKAPSAREDTSESIRATPAFLTTAVSVNAGRVHEIMPLGVNLVDMAVAKMHPQHRIVGCPFYSSEIDQNDVALIRFQGWGLRDQSPSERSDTSDASGPVSNFDEVLKGLLRERLPVRPRLESRHSSDNEMARARFSRRRASPDRVPRLLELPES